MKLKEVEALARRPRLHWRNLIKDGVLADILGAIEGGNMGIPAGVCSSIVDVLPICTAELGGMPVAEFKTRLAALKVGGNCDVSAH